MRREQGMNPDEYSQTIALLERAGSTSIALSDSETMHLMNTVLQLELSYFAAVRQVIREGRWRAAKDPVSYVRAAAWRTALPDKAWERPRGLHVPADIGHDEFIDIKTAYPGPTKMEGVWHAGDDDDASYMTAGERLRKKVPDRFCVEVRSSEPDFPKQRVPDWSAIGKAAGLDEGETEVLKYKVAGLNREEAIGRYSRDSDRKRIQAAWRRFERHGCFERVAAVISGGPNPVRDNT